MIFDYLIILLFFAAYKLKGIFVAISLTMGAYAALTLYKLIAKKEITILQWGSLILVEALGALSLVFHDSEFFVYKPTAVYFIFGLSFNLSRLVKDRTPLVKYLLQHHVEMPNFAWHRLNLSWAFFFYFMAAANTYVAYNYSLDFWVDYKLFGTFGLLLLFVIPQAFYISKHGNHLL